MHLSRHLQVLAASFPERFPPDHMAKLKWYHIYGGLLNQLKVMVAYLKDTPNERTYFNYLHAAWGAEKQEVMEPSHGQTADSTDKPRVMSFFPL